ncbi:MAG TPA: hypothetical protein VHV83_14085 [Armatimonadota bacterium]|nr:hypothetical protein [Armatimonadota bacterium]
MRLQQRLLPILTMVFLLVVPIQAAVLLTNGDFEAPTAGRTVPAWSSPLQEGRLAIVQEEKNHYLAMTNNAGDWLASIQQVKLPAGCRVIQVSGRAYVKAITPGKESWMTARVALDWKDKDGKTLKTLPVSPEWRTPTKGWTWFATVLAVPSNAVSLNLMAALGNCTGQVNFDDLSVVSDNILVNGNFEMTNPSGTALGWSNVGVVPGIKLLTDGANHIFSIENADPAKCITCPQSIPLDPSWRTVEVSGRAHVIKAEQGKESWQHTRLQITWYDDKGKMVNPYPQFPTWPAPSGGWSKFSYTLDIPPQVTRLVVEPAIFNTVGQAEFDDLRITVAKDPNVAADADLPEGQRLFWGEEPVETISATRAQVCLNGLWKFYPLANNVSRDVPTSGWGYIPVPGAWAASEWEGLQALPNVVAQGNGPAWKGLGRYHAADTWNAVNSAWYQRTIKIPADWKDRAVLLKFARVSTDAEVWVNGTDCGRISWPSGTVDITKAVQPGTIATLNVLVVCSTDKDVETVFMGAATDQVYTKKVKVEVRGIIDDVFLVAQPRGPIVSDVFVQPSTRKQQLALDVELSNVTEAGPVTLTARCVNEQGQVEKTFQATVQATAGQSPALLVIAK